MRSSLPTSSANCKALELRSRFPSSEAFLSAYNPDRQALFARHPDRVFLGTAPPLARIANAYGAAVAESFVEIQIQNLSEYAGCTRKLSSQQIEEAAQLIITEWGYITSAEICYFFWLFKSGEFGEFYGAVDRMKIMRAMRQFLKIRSAEIDRLRRRQAKAIARQEYERSKRCALTFEEYQELHWLFNMGFEPQHLHKP